MSFSTVEITIKLRTEDQVFTSCYVMDLNLLVKLPDGSDNAVVANTAKELWVAVKEEAYS
jgi:hypothetical protein